MRRKTELDRLMQNTTQHLEQKINKAREIDQDDNEDDEEED